jgi:ribosomal protein L11 methyltransferase
MTDFILDISFDTRDSAIEEMVQARLFLTPSSGSTSSEVNGTTTISAYFDSAEDRDEGTGAVAGIDGIELKTVERRRVDWLGQYQQSLEPIVIGERFVVVPDAALIPSGDRLAIIVPQEQAFGTGSHETTSLCITMLESLPRSAGSRSAGIPAGRSAGFQPAGPLEAKRGLDIGAGSGILAIAMTLLGASRVLAFDNDLDAYGALRDNRIRNRVREASMPLFIGTLEALRGGLFDVVTMNIVPEVIVPMLGEVVTHLAPGAVLILSGILVTRRDDVVQAAMQHQLRLYEEREKGEWWCGRFTAR